MDYSIIKCIFRCSFILLFHAKSIAQEIALNWKFKVQDRVLASPVIEGNATYVGDMAGVFYSIDLSTGEELWRFETNGNIQARATVINEGVFFESANVFYFVNRSSGKLIWKFDPKITAFVFTYQDRKWPYKIDPYDDKRSAGFVNNGRIYIGASNGKVYALDVESGEVKNEFNTDDNSPVRSSPLVKDGNLYFGDWEGIVYSYSLESNRLNWKKKTYRQDKPYGTFGGIVSEFTTFDGLLFFGARNHVFNVLELSTGEKDWTYIDPRKGWIIGDPVIFKDTLYVTGSDNFSVFAFNPAWGHPLWSYTGDKNIYTKPVVTEEWVIYTAGNSYDESDKGIVGLLDRTTGELITSYESSLGIFSSPAFQEGNLIFGCYDEHVYSLKIE